MKLRNKKTGEIMRLSVKCENGGELKTFDLNTNTDQPITLAELNEEWEDAPEEPKEYWFLSGRGEVKCIEDENTVFDKDHKSIGNYFETKEEAEKTVEKLKAWKRLKEANIDYKLSREYDDFTETMLANVSFSFNSYPLVGKDLDLLFGGEE